MDPSKQQYPNYSVAGQNTQPPQYSSNVPYQQNQGYQQGPYQQNASYPNQSNNGMQGGYPYPGSAYPGQAAPSQPYPGPAPAQSYPAPGSSSNSVAPSAPALPLKYNGEVPADDLDENAVQSNTMSGPPPSYDLVVNGYENAGLSEVPVGPPPPFEQIHLDPAIVDSTAAKQLSKEDAREALLKLVEQHICWGKGAANNMDVQTIQSTSAYHYIMETYTEGRKTKFAQVPYKGEIVDGPHMGPAPLPWEIACSPKQLFKNDTVIIEVPHTSCVKTCNICYGCGINRCWKCHGRGKVRCSSCHGSGHRTVLRNGESLRENCAFCHGRGRKRCLTCNGCGCLTCYECKGYRQVRQFIQLFVNYQNMISEHVIERTDLPNELIKNVLGDNIFTQTAPRVRSIEHFFDEEVNQKSNELVAHHSAAWPHLRTLQQKHTLRSVPVYECSFKHSDNIGRFWVYGHQKEVFTEDYPHTCCCCSCAIL